MSRISAGRFPFSRRLRRAAVFSRWWPPIASRYSFGRCAGARFQAHGFKPVGNASFPAATERAMSPWRRIRRNSISALQQAYDDFATNPAALCRQERLRARGTDGERHCHDINNALSPVALYPNRC